MKLYLMLDLDVLILILTVRLDQNSILKFLFSNMLVFDQDWAVLHEQLADHMSSLESDPNI